MTYAAVILKDSINPLGNRLTTFEVTLPRPYLAEFNTHRMLSRNSASSRAIPTEKQIERVLSDPYVPDFNRRVKGMGVGEALSDRENQIAQSKWLRSRDAAVEAAQGLLETDKSRANRLLEPFMWQTIIASGTEWENFFNLRDHEAAQPEFRTIASMMRFAYEHRVPEELGWGEWHLPLVFPEDGVSTGDAPLVSAGRCARVSYDRQHDEDHPTDSLERWLTLSQSGHWSPGEHPARSVTEKEVKLGVQRRMAELAMARDQRRPLDKRYLESLDFCGNFRGFVQLRKHYAGEDVFQG